MDDGEKEAIYLALELKSELLIEEKKGRRVSQDLGITISGIGAEIIQGFRQNFITASDAKKKLLDLFQNYRLNHRIYTILLNELQSLSE